MREALTQYLERKRAQEAAKGKGKRKGKGKGKKGSADYVEEDPTLLSLLFSSELECYSPFEVADLQEFYDRVEALPAEA